LKILNISIEIIISHNDILFYSGCNNVQDILLVSITWILSLRNVLQKKYAKTYFFLLLKTIKEGYILGGRD